MTDTLHTQELETKGAGLLARAQAITIVTAEDYAAAGDYRKTAKAHLKLVETTLKDPKDKAKAAHKAICDLEAKLTAPAEEVVRVVDQKMLTWSREQERVRLEEQRKAEAAALKEAQKQQEREAKKLEKKGDVEAAAEVRQAPVAPAPVVVQSRIPENVGATVRKVWKGRVVNKAELLKNILAGHPLASLDMVVIDQRELDKRVGAMKDGWILPGTEAYQQESMAGTR